MINELEPVAVVDEDDAPEDIFDVAADYHKEWAMRIWPNGCTLRCPRCGRKENFTTSQMARFLATGMPQCCRQTNQTMQLVDFEPAV